VAYRLELPPSSSIHPVFHVSQLKKAVGAHHSVTAEPPSDTAIWSVPERIIQRRLLHQGTSSVMQGLIKWSNLLESLATWEELEALRQQFPRTLVWEHLGAQGGGVSATALLLVRLRPRKKVRPAAQLKLKKMQAASPSPRRGTCVCLAQNGRMCDSLATVAC
jgi:hypothetical protein